MFKTIIHIIILLFFLPLCAMSQLSINALLIAPETSIQKPQNPWLIKKINLKKVAKPNSNVLMMSQHYIPKHVEGFFCKAEDKANKKVAMPIRFRLGNLDYVNRLEGKYIKI